MSPKFNFVPEKSLKEAKAENVFMVTILSPGNMRFHDDYIGAYGLEGKSVRLYIDLEKRSVGWQVLEGTTDLDTLNDSRMLKRNPSNGQILLSIGRIMKSMFYDKGYKPQKLPINIYKSTLHAGDIHYVLLPDKVVKSEGEPTTEEEQKSASDTQG